MTHANSSNTFNNDSMISIDYQIINIWCISPLGGNNGFWFDPITIVNDWMTPCNFKIITKMTKLCKAILTFKLKHANNTASLTVKCCKSISFYQILSNFGTPIFHFKTALSCKATSIFCNCILVFLHIIQKYIYLYYF